MVDETPSAELGKLIETYRPIEPVIWKDIPSSIALLFAFFGAIFVGFAVFFGLYSLISKGTLDIEWIGFAAIVMTGILGGGSLASGILLGFFNLISRLFAAYRGFRVEVYENGFCIHKAGGPIHFYWKNITYIWNTSSRYGGPQIFIFCRGDNNGLILESDQILRVRELGEMLKAHLKAYRKAQQAASRKPSKPLSRRALSLAGKLLTAYSRHKLKY